MFPMHPSHDAHDLVLGCIGMRWHQALGMAVGQVTCPIVFSQGARRTGIHHHDNGIRQAALGIDSFSGTRMREQFQNTAAAPARLQFVEMAQSDETLPELTCCKKRDHASFNPNISRASCGEATSRPAWRAYSASFSINGPFESALVPSDR